MLSFFISVSTNIVHPPIRNVSGKCLQNARGTISFDFDPDFIDSRPEMRSKECLRGIIQQFLWDLPRTIGAYPVFLSKTSQAYPASWPALRECTTAFSSTTDPCSVDQITALFHLPQNILIEQMKGLFSQRQ